MNEADTKSFVDKSDPSPLTTAAILREIFSLKELIDARLNEMDKAVILLQNVANHSPSINEVYLQHETRFDGMDKAIRLLQDAADKFPHRIDEKILALEKVHEEKFASIQVQFKERDVRGEQTARDTKVAVDAALQAAEKARTSSNESFALSIAKSENATTKQIDQTTVQNATSMQASALQVSDLKERVTRLEGTGAGVATNKVDNRLLIGILIAVVGMIVGVVGLVGKLN